MLYASHEERSLEVRTAPLITTKICTCTLYAVITVSCLSNSFVELRNWVGLTLLYIYCNIYLLYCCILYAGNVTLYLLFANTVCWGGQGCPFTACSCFIASSPRERSRLNSPAGECKNVVPFSYWYVHGMCLAETVRCTVVARQAIDLC